MYVSIRRAYAIAWSETIETSDEKDEASKVRDVDAVTLILYASVNHFLYSLDVHFRCEVHKEWGCRCSVSDNPSKPFTGWKKEDCCLGCRHRKCRCFKPAKVVEKLRVRVASMEPDGGDSRTDVQLEASRIYCSLELMDGHVKKEHVSDICPNCLRPTCFCLC